MEKPKAEKEAQHEAIQEELKDLLIPQKSQPQQPLSTEEAHHLEKKNEGRAARIKHEKEVAEKEVSEQKQHDQELAQNLKDKWRQMKQDGEKRASLSGAIAKSVNETTQTVSKLADQGNKLVVNDLDAEAIIATAQAAAKQIQQQRFESSLPESAKPQPKVDISAASINDGELKGVTGGNLSDVVDEDKEGLWTSDGMRAVDSFLSSQFKKS